MIPGIANCQLTEKRLDTGKKKGKLLPPRADVFLPRPEMNVSRRLMARTAKITSSSFERGVKDKDAHVSCGSGEACLEFLNGTEGFSLSA